MDLGHDAASLLAFFGIIGSVNFDGITTYSINLVKSQQKNVSTSRAVFDATSRCWRLVPQEEEQSSTSDWTETLPDRKHVRFLKSVDWAASPLGAMSNWSLSLQQSTHMMLADNRPTCLQWGPDRVMIYNEAYMNLITGSHPRAMGLKYSQALPTTSSVIEPIFSRCTDFRETVPVPEIEIYMERKGFLEEWVSRYGASLQVY